MSTEYEHEFRLTLTEAQCLTMCMLCEGKELRNADAEAIRHDMVRVLMAWRRGKLLSRREVPMLEKLYRDFTTPNA